MTAALSFAEHAVTVLAYLFIVAGVVAVLMHATGLTQQRQPRPRHRAGDPPPEAGDVFERLAAHVTDVPAEQHRLATQWTRDSNRAAAIDATALRWQGRCEYCGHEHDPTDPNQCVIPAQRLHSLDDVVKELGIDESEDCIVCADDDITDIDDLPPGLADKALRSMRECEADAVVRLRRVMEEVDTDG